MNTARTETPERDPIAAWLEERRTAGDVEEAWQECKDWRLMVGVVGRMVRERGSNEDAKIHTLARLIGALCWEHAKTAASIVAGAARPPRPDATDAYEGLCGSATMAAGAAAFDALSTELYMTARKLTGEDLESALVSITSSVVHAVREGARAKHVAHSEAVIERAMQLAEDCASERIAWVVRERLPVDLLQGWLERRVLP